MADPSGVQNRYVETCKELELKPHKFILKVLDTERQEQIIDPQDNMELKLPGNNLFTNTTGRLRDEDALVLYKSLANSMYVTEIDLRYNNMTDEGAKYIGKLIEESCALQQLNIMCNDIGPVGAEYIATGVQMNHTLISLRLNGNKIGSKGGMCFAGVLQVNTVLEELDLGDTDQDTQSMIAMATVLKQNSTLRVLNMNRPLLFSQQEETTVHYSLMLKVNNALQELHLQKCDIKDFGAERLVDNLIENIGLKYLDLSCNRITRDGALAISKLLKRNTPLEILDLGFNRIEDDGAVSISEALIDLNRTLKTLVITSNNIRAPGLVAIARSMHTNDCLQSVFIWGNHLEEPACVAFHELIKSERLEEEYTDVKSYVVDGHTYLSELNHGIRRHYYWSPSYGPDASLAIY
ncbi:leucine-rich repeat-containing protein 34-like isoform X2 [Anneissia japonica]|uniref:leucine-rich repeat-containing protein 34-like isoform X2 n=1 Tax=Anneissia japonica TaxID=1529436 RepID=UPI0014256540|nr:leucine-rich repeat-containing protein 34-like isoform X2 [Anneissia japonica]XP_033107598.1 leucine-rich repeat-containing protein 34-like isoform X2 [Anneissia japonica]XP_033107599.1 leucine-rich repeat-containing protein 34-like isoform X2 [Anneissia japonica]